MRLFEGEIATYVYCQWSIFDKIVDVNITNEWILDQVFYSIFYALIVVCNSEDDCRYRIELVFSERLCRKEALGKSAFSDPLRKIWCPIQRVDVVLY